jgi:SAM-dependent methyltransferase
MTPEIFFDLFVEELKQREEMQRYYKFLKDSKSYEFRKNYFLERLRYIYKHIKNKDHKVWDCGSGYGTTGLFLAMNGIKTHGTTLEFYYDTVSKRYDYWNQHGNANLFTCSYENLFDNPPPPQSYDVIIVQDTLHHLEPIDTAFEIFHQTLKPLGKIVAIEENGKNIIQRIKLYKYRGSKRIITQWDEKLQKDIMIGNENIRSLKKWNALLKKHHFALDNTHTQYVRYYLPFMYGDNNGNYLLEQERLLQTKSIFRKEYFFFGINFIAHKQ